MTSEILAGFFTGLFKALIDTIKFHQSSWIFNFAHKYFSAEVCFWLRSDWSSDWNPWTGWIIGDGWHFFQNLMWLSVFYGILNGGNLLSLLCFYLSWAISFNLFFSIIFRKRGVKCKLKN